MTVRLVLLFVASLAVASVAGAACLTCVPTGIQGWGSCEPTTSGWCTYTCCLWDPGTRCVVDEHVYPCAEEPLRAPSPYFATTLPLYTEGSALRLRLAPAKPVQRKCGPLLARRDARA
ncbi:MAG TPA: hypothetical protein VGF48_03265 [Thermoanaerobaculia bacterium]|jgi:hypothetical protein